METTVSVQQWTGHESKCLRHALRLSVRAFADQLGIGFRTVARWEAAGTDARLRGESQALLDTMLTRADSAAVQRFEKSLQTNLAERAITSGNSVATADPHNSWVRAASPSSVAVPAAVDAEDSDVNRRSFLQAVAVAGLAGRPLEVLRHDLSAVIRDAAGTVDLDDWESILWTYARSYVDTPPAQLLIELSADLGVAREQTRRARTNELPGVQRVIGVLAAFTAQTVGNLGDSTAAVRWWRTARQAVDASKDTGMRVWVRGREVISGQSERPSADLLVIADQAAAVSRTPGLGTGSVLAGRAQVLASLGRADEARMAMAELYAAAERLPAGIIGDTTSMFGWSEYRLRHTESHVYTHIDDSRAVGSFDRALQLYPQPLFRERTQVELYRALRLVRTGDPNAGLSAATDAVAALPPMQRINGVRQIAQSVLTAVPRRETDAAADLRELISLPNQ